MLIGYEHMTPEQELMKKQRVAPRNVLVQTGDYTLSLAVIAAFEVAARRTEASRNALYKAWQDNHKNDPVKTEAYELAIDELDKIVFAMRTMADIPKARERWVDGVYENV